MVTRQLQVERRQGKFAGQDRRSTAMPRNEPKVWINKNTEVYFREDDVVATDCRSAVVAGRR